MQVTARAGSSTHAAAISPLIRIALFVRDLERSRRFYQELLGLAEVHLPTMDFGATAANTLLGLPQHSTLRGLILKSTGPNFGMVGLFEIAPAQPAAAPPALHQIRAGESLMVFYCPMMQKVLQDLERFGGQLVAGPEKFYMAGSDIAPVIEVMLRDPDGFVVNLIEAPVSNAYQTDPVSFAE